MSVFSALSYGVAGMQAQSSRLAALSNNIANTSTAGYRRVDVDFAALVTSGGTGERTPSAGGVTTLGRTDVARNGAIEGSTNGTDLALRGAGFFLVEDAAGGGEPLLTRAGQFRVDDQGRLVNANGYALLGVRTDDAGAPTSPLSDPASLQTLDVANLTFTGSPTTQVGYTGNIPAQATGGANPPETSTLTVFDDLAAPRTLTLQWTPNAGAANQWTLDLFDNGANVGAVDVSFNAVGPQAGSPAAYASALPVANGVVSVPINGGAQTVQLNLGAPGSYDGVTQFDGPFATQSTRDGAGFGAFSGVEIDEAGVVFARFDNGQTRPVYQIPVARNANDDGLNAIDGAAFQRTAASGELRIGVAGQAGFGAVSAFAVERSNVDIAEELTALIETQRAYSSNTTVVRTADEMLDEATRLKR